MNAIACDGEPATLRRMEGLHIIILAAGQSSRMRSDTSKVLHVLAGWTVLQHVLEAAQQLTPAQMILVTSPDGDDIMVEARRHHADIVHVVQHIPQGTGDAVKAALGHIPQSGRVLVLYADSPLMQADTLASLVAHSADYAVTLTTMQPQDPAEYGRVIVNEAGLVERIVEYRDADETQRRITLCNGGVMVLDAAQCHTLIQAISNHNAKAEYYLTDVVEHARHAELPCGAMLVDEQELLGINTRAELAQAEQLIQQRLRVKALADGVGMVAPETLHLQMDTCFGYDVLLHPYIVFGPNVVLGDHVEVKSFSHVEGAVIHDHAVIGPYARLRPGANIGRHAHVGNFVEIKQARLHDGAKVGHLSYLGDATIGAETNIGAGTITCNYDGMSKHHTHIGESCFIGSDTALVAPVSVGAHVTIAAGSVITEDIADHSLAFGRARQVTKRHDP